MLRMRGRSPDVIGDTSSRRIIKELLCEELFALRLARGLLSGRDVV